MKYHTMAWAGSNAVIATGSLPRRQVMVRVGLKGGGSRVLMQTRGSVIAANPDGTALVLHKGRMVVRLPGGRIVGVGKGVQALRSNGRVLAIRNAPGSSYEPDSRLIEINPRNNRSRVLFGNVRAVGLAPRGNTIAVQRAAFDESTGEDRWVISTINARGQVVKDFALVGGVDGTPAAVSDGGDNPQAVFVPSSDGQRILIQTPFIEEG